MTRRRGNPNWGRTLDSYPPMPVSLSGWDLLLYSLNLREPEALKSPKVREYVVKYHRNRFVPTKVLEHFGMDGSFFD
jgi:hypothetical protein